MKYEDLTLERLKKEVLMKGGYLSTYTRICIYYSNNIMKLMVYLKETSDFYKPLYKSDEEDPLVIAKKFLNAPLA